MLVLLVVLRFTAALGERDFVIPGSQVWLYADDDNNVRLFQWRGCLPGYGGDGCGFVCDTNPCENGGSCVDDDAYKLSCQCTAGWGGGYCQRNLCDSITCSNGGTKTPVIGGCTCQCPDGFTGTSCDQTITDICAASNPCENGGTCITDYNSVPKCSCPIGFTGDHCEDVLQPCEESSCKNNGTCLNDYKANKTVCICAAGFTGLQCEEAVSNPCSSNPCQNGATCLNSRDGTAVCVCPIGFAGLNCEYDLCNMLGCQNGASTIPSPNGCSCKCAQGYYGQKCENHDDCPPHSHLEDHASICVNTCRNPTASETCENTKTVSRCVCDYGPNYRYVLEGDECINLKDCPS